MKLPVWFIVIAKELKDASRDRRAIAALLLFPVMGPAMIYFLLTSILDIGQEASNISLPVIGAENSADLVDYLRQNGISITPVALPEDIEEVSFDRPLTSWVEDRITNREYNYVMIIPESFGARISRSRPVNVEIHHDSSRTTAEPQVQRLERLIQAWGREMATLRLLVRGIDPGVITPVRVQTIDVASLQARARSILGMVPLFVIMAAFVTGMGVAVDVTAGERERKSLEPLLVNPVQRSSIVLGKWLAAVVFSAAGLLTVLVLNLFALSQVPLEQLGFSFDVGPVEIIGILVTTLPLAFFATSIQVFIGIFARSFKDAQAYLSLIMLVPIAPYFYNIFNTTGREFWMNFVPMLGQNMLLNDVVSGRSVPIMDFILAGGTVLLCSLGFMALAARLFRRERIIFS